MRLFKRSNRKGQGLSEYGLVLGLVAVVSIAALSSTGTAVSGLLGNIAGAVSAGSNPCDLNGCLSQCDDSFRQSFGPEGPSGPAFAALFGCHDTCFDAFFGNNCMNADL